MSRVNLFLLQITSIIFHLAIGETSEPCPCTNIKLCEPVNTHFDHEVFVFSVNKDNWPKYDWTKITTIVEVGYHNPALLCYAHSKGARVVNIANFGPTTALPNKTARAEWITTQVKYIRDNHLDGINVDYESSIHADQTDIRNGLTMLMQELNQAMKKEFKYSQVTFDLPFRPTTERAYDYNGIAKACDFIFDMAYDMWWNVSDNKAHANCDITGIQYVIADGCFGVLHNHSLLLTIDYAWSPNCIDGRCYDFTSIINYVDFAFVMAYDERSQIFFECAAWANSPYNQTTSGVEQFMKQGIPANKIVLGLPWYGYNYPCVSYTQNNTCLIKSVPFRGVKCSDAAGSQDTYTDIVEKILPKSITGLLWDDVAKSPYFTYKDSTTNQLHQVWFDNPKSLSIKYNYAKIMGLRGVGMWEADGLDYSDTIEGQDQRKEMWGILP